MFFDDIKLVDEMIAVNAPEMDIVVAYFARFLEEGLAGVQYVPK